MGFEIINKLKKEKGITNAQLAEMSGVTLSTLDKITAGINTNPKLDTLQGICRALGCSLDDFDDSPKNEKASTSDYPKAEASLAERGALFYKQLVAAGYLGEGEDFTDAQVQIISAVLDILDAAFPKNKVPESSNSREVG